MAGRLLCIGRAGGRSLIAAFRTDGRTSLILVAYIFILLAFVFLYVCFYGLPALELHVPRLGTALLLLQVLVYLVFRHFQGLEQDYAHGLLDVGRAAGVRERVAADACQPGPYGTADLVHDHAFAQFRGIQY